MLQLKQQKYSTKATRATEFLKQRYVLYWILRPSAIIWLDEQTCVVFVEAYRWEAWIDAEREVKVHFCEGFVVLVLTQSGKRTSTNKRLKVYSEWVVCPLITSRFFPYQFWSQKHLIHICERSSFLASEWYFLDKFTKILIFLHILFQRIPVLLVFGIENSL